VNADRRADDDQDEHRNVEHVQAWPSPRARPRLFHRDGARGDGLSRRKAQGPAPKGGQCGQGGAWCRKDDSLVILRNDFQANGFVPVAQCFYKK